MISTTIGAETVWIVTEEPNWISAVKLRCAVPVERERGLTGRELRQPVGATLRCVLSWTATLDRSALNTLRDAIAQAGDDPFIVPAWPFLSTASTFVPADHVGGGLWVAWDALGDPSVVVGSSPGSPLPPAFAPALYGRLEVELPTLRNPDLAEVKYTLTEDSPGEYALAPPSRTWTSGPALPDSTVPKVFPLPIDWSQTRQSGLPEVEVVRKGFGPGRRRAAAYYPQTSRRAAAGYARPASLYDVATLLRWWVDRYSQAGHHYVTTAAEVATLDADADAGDPSITLTDADDIGPYRYLELRNVDASEVVKVTSIAGDVCSLATNLAADWDADTTLISLVALARHTDDELTLDFSTPEFAKAKLAWTEVPEEYTVAGGETRGTSLGQAALTACLYEFTLDNLGATTTYRYTGFERDLSDGTNTWTSHPIEHSDFHQSIKLDRDDVTLKLRSVAAIAGFLPGELSHRVMVTIYECAVSGGTASSVTQRWTGEITKVSWDGPFAQATAQGPYALFDRPLPRLTIQPMCNHQVFDTLCGLDIDDWTFGAVVASDSDNQVTLDTWSLDGGLPTGWGFAGYFALGYLSRASGEKLIILDSTALASDEITLTLESAPATEWGASEAVEVVPGCDGTREGCSAYHVTNNPRGKWDNYEQFGGMPYVPPKNPSFTPLKKSNSSTGKK